MKQLIIFFGLTLFTLTSCSGNKNETKIKKKAIAFKTDLRNNRSERNQSQLFTKDVNLFKLYDLEENIGKKIGFVSLSDKYRLSDHEDSLAIPNLSNIKDSKELQFFTLSPKYRKRFLDKTGISESDSLFIYDYSRNELLSFPIKMLNATANLSVYSYGEEDLTQYDYEIGFAIDKKLLEGLDESYNYNLVYVGQNNPFVKRQMKSIVWKKISSKEFPLIKIKLSRKIKGTINTNHYLYETDNYKYYLKDINDTVNVEYIDKRHLMIVEKTNGKVIIERLFKVSEGTSITPLNFGTSDFIEQWTGKLLKERPDVVFGFEYFSFGCENIIFINPKENDIYINCDNRH